MKEILIFAGTTEGRKLSEFLAAAGVRHTVCVATEYGEIVLKEHPLVSVHQGRMNQEEIREYIEQGAFAAVVDATHPYAAVITENIKAAIKESSVLYLRLKRETVTEKTEGQVICFDTNEACAEALEKTEGNILLTTGSKELAKYCISEKLRDRLYVRVLPSMESITACQEQGIRGKQILALQGPFSVELNEAMLRQYRISCLVTKSSGRTGGYQEKLEAAERVGIPVYVIGQLQTEEGDTFREVCQKLEKLCNQRIKQVNHLEIILAGVGMGSRDSLTREVEEAVKAADILLGAERMLAPYQPRVEKKAVYKAEQIIPYLKELQENSVNLETGKVVILFSGDSGFYSGCQSLYQALQEEIVNGGLQATLRILPGISSVSYLASCIGESYQETAICSMHGKEIPDLMRKLKRERKLFLLTSGVKDIHKLGRLLEEENMQDCEIVAGYQLSYPNQQIMYLTPAECCEVTEEGLYTCMIRNRKTETVSLIHGTSDEEFIREKVPMTKEEVREVSICKMKLHKDAIVYDVGSGTGSIAVEIAGLSEGIQVYAIERKADAVALIEKNKEKFQLPNISVVSAEAPDGLEELPVPTHAFIGGSGSRMKEILSALYQKNSRMRIVINAVSIETICEIKEILSQYPVEQEEVVQVQVSRTRKMGRYHLMQAENPVWICAFYFCEQME